MSSEETILKFTQSLYQDFWVLPMLGGTFGFYHTKRWTIASFINYSFMYTLLPTVIAMLFYTNFLVGHNLSLLSQSSHLMIAGIVALSASLIVTWKRLGLLPVAELYVNPYICDYSKNEYFDKLIEETRKKKTRSVLFWVIVYGTCGLVGGCQPLIDSFFDRSYEVPSVNGAWLLDLPFVIWFPFDLEHSTAAWLFVYVLEVVFLMYSATMVTSAITLCFTLLERILDQLVLLKRSVLKLDERAASLYRELFCQHSRAKVDLEEQYENCYYQCLVQNVVHHDEIIRLVKAFMFVASYPLAVPFFGGAILLGMAAITITAVYNIFTNDDPRMGPKFFAGVLAFSEGYNMYLLCKVGQRFEDLSNALYDALYFTSWYERSIRCRRALIIMRYGCRRPISLRVAKVLVLNIQLFGELFQSAYSIFNLKSASLTKGT